MSTAAFYVALAFRESSGDQRCVNKYGYMGLYQMGPAALQDAGYMRADKTWTGKNGINSQSDFLNNRDAQNDAVQTYHYRLWRYIPQSVRDSVGRVVGGIDISTSGLLAGAHLRGQGGVTKFIQSNGQIDETDALGTHCSEYIQKFGGYDVSSVIA